MIISYNWLCDYLPDEVEKPIPPKLSEILTSVGLEVEGYEKYESVKGGLKGLIIGEVIACEKHPGADKLKLTRVDIGQAEPLSIVCGAPNVARGQKVIVAPVGATIYPIKGEPVTMKLAKIRGEESQGMICASDEIGLGEDHSGILILPDTAVPGHAVSEWMDVCEDIVFSIGLTPNHMDAMSHLGVANDVCAWLSHHHKKTLRPKSPDLSAFKSSSQPSPISIRIENEKDCARYSGLCMDSIVISPSPLWIQHRLKAIGIRPINNIVDISNFVLHELGQPLHIYDADQITGNEVIVKNLPEGTSFITLDEKQRTIHRDDLMICNASEGMCIAGVFGGLKSGVSETTRNIFLESAWFNPTAIRKTSFRHGLRTDAAVHFEKGMDISQTVNAIKRTALLLEEWASATVIATIVDAYPHPKPRRQIHMSFKYLRKISGNDYPETDVCSILESLGFAILGKSDEGVLVEAPYNKPDIQLPADIVEEIMRIDGLDNIAIPANISISPSVDSSRIPFAYREKTANYLVGLGFNEIFTNSITNSAYYAGGDTTHLVKMINSLSADLDTMRPSVLETGLESIAYNLNRKNSDLRFFEFGKTYSTEGVGKYEELNHLALYVTGQIQTPAWNSQSVAVDFYYLKAVCENLLRLLGLPEPQYTYQVSGKIESGASVQVGGKKLVEFGSLKNSTLQRFGIKQNLFFADFNWDAILELIAKNKLTVKELPKQLPVYRDLAMLVQKSLTYDKVEQAIRQTRLDKLSSYQLFDVFESDKLGAGKKSLALSFTFLDEEKTLTDKEIDNMMQKIMKSLETQVGAEIRKQ